jgi:hypothetical protein
MLTSIIVRQLLNVTLSYNCNQLNLGIYLLWGDVQIMGFINHNISLTIIIHFSFDFPVKLLPSIFVTSSCLKSLTVVNFHVHRTITVGV